LDGWWNLSIFFSFLPHPIFLLEANNISK
jgi:hypothetical protein